MLHGLNELDYMDAEQSLFKDLQIIEHSKVPKLNMKAWHKHVNKSRILPPFQQQDEPREQRVGPLYSLQHSH